MTVLVERWLAGFADTARRSYGSALMGFEGWLRERGEFSSLEDAVSFQKKAVGDDRYRLSDLLSEYVRGRQGTYKSLTWYYAVVRSFFFHSRAELPRVRVSFTPSKDATVGRLDLDVFRVLLRGAGLRDQAVYLTLFQGIVDQHRFFSHFNPRGFELGEHIRLNGVSKPYQVSFLRGRKRNPNPYSTWIGHDALEAWRLYFERERGYPKKGESAALDQFQRPLTKDGFLRAHTRRLRKLGYIKEHGTNATRYGYNLHELRDLSRSVLEKAKGEGFNTSSAEYWMGHKVDPLFYNKIWKLDPEYNLKQYQIAQRHLNILSTPLESEQIQQQDERIRGLEKQLADLRQMIHTGLSQLGPGKRS